MNGSKLIQIKEGVNYTPVTTGIVALGGTVTKTVVALHCVNTNTSVLKMQSILNTDTEIVTFPPHSFIQGHVYNIVLAVIHDLGGANFVGYLQ